MLPGQDRMTLDPAVMGGQPCFAGTRVTVGTITGLMASGANFSQFLELYPYLLEADLLAARTYEKQSAEKQVFPSRTS